MSIDVEDQYSTEEGGGEEYEEEEYEEEEQTEPIPFPIEDFSCFFQRRQIDKALRLFDIPHAMDFTACLPSRFPPPDRGESLLQLIAGCPLVSRTEAKKTLQALCDRLRDYAPPVADCVNWQEVHLNGQLDFLSLAGRYQRFSPLWAVVQNVDYFKQLERPIPIAIIWRWELERMPAAEREQFSFGMVVEASEATGRLYRVVLRNPWDVENIEACVNEGADVMFTGECCCDCTILGRLSGCGCSASLLAGLKARGDIHIDRGEGGVDILSNLPLVDLTAEEDAVKILTAICEHVESHPKDKVVWDTVGAYGDDFINSAAKNHRLSLFYPLVEHLPYFGDHVTPIPLKQVWSFDWERLSDGQRSDFNIDAAHMVVANAATARLWDIRYDRQTPSRTVKIVRQCVQDGADVSFSDRRGQSRPIYLCFVPRAKVPALLECLLTEKPLDFGNTPPFHDSLLHALCRPSFSLGEALMILSTLVCHILCHPDDIIPWEEKEHSFQMNFLQFAAENKRLAFFYPAVQDVPYFKDRTSPIPLEYVYEQDWRRLPISLQMDFKVDVVYTLT